MSAQTPIPTEAILISELSTDADLLPLVGSFVERLNENIVRIDRLYQRQEWDALSRLAHQLKGASGGYGFPAIGSAAGRLEDHLQNKSDDVILRTAIDELVGLCCAAIRGRGVMFRNAGDN